MVFLRLEESLIDFQGKVAQVVKAVCVSVDDLDLIVVFFQFAGVDRAITVEILVSELE